MVLWEPRWEICPRSEGRERFSGEGDFWAATHREYGVS